MAYLVGTGKVCGALIEQIMVGGLRQAAKFVSENEVVKATRRVYKKEQPLRQAEILVTIGRPNYAERRFIALCRKAGEPFPVKKIRIKAMPATRKRR